MLTLIADPTRMRLLFALDAAEELCVGDLAQALGASGDAVGYGLRMLRTAGLVTRRKHGRMVFYRLAPEFPETAAPTLPDPPRRTVRRDAQQGLNQKAPIGNGIH